MTGISWRFGVFNAESNGIHGFCFRLRKCMGVDVTSGADIGVTHGF